MNKIVKRTFAAAIALCMILVMSVSVFAAAITKDEAANRALKDAGFTKQEVDRLRVKKDGKEYDIHFKDIQTGDRYEYEIAVSSGKIKEKSAEYVHDFTSSKNKIGKTKAISIAAKASGVQKKVVKKGTCRYKRDDGEWIYEIKFRSGKWVYEYEILAPNGKIIEFSQEYK